MPDEARGSTIAPASGSAHSTRRLPVAITAAVLLLVVLALVGGVYHRSIGRQMALSFVRQPAPYSELYFPDPSALPASRPAGSTAAVRFSIVNKTGGRRSYSWVATASTAVTTPERGASGGSAEIITHGVVLVADRGISTVRFTLRLPTQRARVVTVMVTIPALGQHIDFHTRTT